MIFERQSTLQYKKYVLFIGINVDCQFFGLFKQFRNEQLHLLLLQYLSVREEENFVNSEL